MAKRKHLHHPVSSFISCTLLVLSALLALQLPGPVQLNSPTPAPVTPGNSIGQSPASPAPAHHVAANHVSQASAPNASPLPSSEPSPVPAVTVPEPQPEPGNGHVNYPYVAFGAVNDPMYSQQWDLSKVSAASAWSKTT